MTSSLPDRLGRAFANTAPILPGKVGAAVLALVLSLAGVASAHAATAIIDAASVQQTIRGFGGATVFRPTDPLTTADLDTLFGTGPDQIGLTILRIRVAADDPWRALELANARGAIARGAAVIATPWSPPAAMKTNNNLVAGSLLPSSYTSYATYLNDFARYMAANGAALYAISVQNEPDIAVTYESCDWTAAQMLDFCKNHAGAITATRVIAPESFQFRQGMSDPILNDATAAANVDIIGGHIYGAGLVPYPLAAAKGKEVWMTEHLDLSTDWAGALATAKEIHDCLAVANFNAYLWWYLKRYYGPLGEDGVITKRGHVMSQFAKFIRPEYVRVGATANPTTGVHVSAYKRDRLVIVAVNLGAAAVDQTFTLQGESVRSVTPWVTSASLNLAAQSTINVTSGTFTASLPAGSVTTFVGDVVVEAPVVVVPPKGHTVEAGSTAVLDVTATGAFVSYQWSRNGIALPGATSRLLTLANMSLGEAGAYTVTVANVGGSRTSTPAVLAVASTGNPGRLINISTRSPVGTGDGVQIGGFIIGGTAPKRVLIRSAGPAITVAAGLSGTLADPMFELHDQSTGAIVASSDDWAAGLAPLFARCGAFPWTVGSKDAALDAALAPGAYTALVRGKPSTGSGQGSDGTGIALVEIYDADNPGAANKLLNISSRTLVGNGGDVQIAGFIIGGATAQTVVIRAAGPAVTQVAGLGGMLADPSFELVDQATGAVVATADDWEASLASHFASVGAFPWSVGSKDAALVITLDPGAYTVVVRGKNGETGLALAEVYAEP